MRSWCALHSGQRTGNASRARDCWCTRIVAVNMQASSTVGWQVTLVSRYRWAYRRTAGITRPWRASTRSSRSRGSTRYACHPGPGKIGHRWLDWGLLQPVQPVSHAHDHRMPGPDHKGAQPAGCMTWCTWKRVVVRQHLGSSQPTWPRLPG